MNIFYLTSKELDTDISAKIKSGDICVINDSKTLSICIASSSLDQSRPEGNYIDVVYSKDDTLDILVSNPLIFSYNGISKRIGSSYTLKEIMSKIDYQPLCSFFQECISILNYKEDRFKSNFILDFFLLSKDKLKVYIQSKSYQNIKQEIHSTSVNEKDGIHSEKDPQKDTVVKAKPQEIKAQPDEFYFYDFLTHTEQKEWIRLSDQNMPIRDIFYKLKELNKIKFRQSLKRFNNKYPKLNIYSLKHCSTKKISSNSFTIQLNEFEFLYKDLRDKGYVQISDEIWENKDKKRFRISIQSL